MKDIMIDIETLGTGHNSVITQIGALYFDRDTGDTGKKLLVNIQIQDCLNYGLTVDGGAIKFWLAEKERSFLKEPVTLDKALQMLRDFYEKGVLAWSHATFDFPILANAYKVTSQGFCFPYRNLRDIRTLVDLSSLDYKKSNRKEIKTHNALEDCERQVRYCVECFKAFKGLQNEADIKK